MTQSHEIRTLNGKESPLLMIANECVFFFHSYYFEINRNEEWKSRKQKETESLIHWNAQKKSTALSKSKKSFCHHKNSFDSRWFMKLIWIMYIEPNGIFSHRFIISHVQNGYIKNLKSISSFDWKSKSSLNKRKWRKILRFYRMCCK